MALRGNTNDSQVTTIYIWHAKCTTGKRVFTTTVNSAECLTQTAPTRQPPCKHSATYPKHTHTHTHSIGAHYTHTPKLIYTTLGTLSWLAPYICVIYMYNIYVTSCVIEFSRQPVELEFHLSHIMHWNGKLNTIRVIVSVGVYLCCVSVLLINYLI